jgi:hypothetical protein
VTILQIYYFGLCPFSEFVKTTMFLELVLRPSSGEHGAEGNMLGAAVEQNRFFLFT